MSKTKSRTKQAPSGDPSAPAQTEGEGSAELAGSASRQAQDVQHERSAEDERYRLIAI